jgi:hypothetical protein
MSLYKFVFVLLHLLFIVYIIFLGLRVILVYFHHEYCLTYLTFGAEYFFLPILGSHWKITINILHKIRF